MENLEKQLKEVEELLKQKKVERQDPNFVCKNAVPLELINNLKTEVDKVVQEINKLKSK